MGLDPQTQGDARTKKHADVCNGYLPTELASEEERKWVVQTAATAGATSLSRIKTERIGKTLTRCARKFGG
jgi:uncharacterized protein YqeY